MAQRLKDRDLRALLFRAAAVIEDPRSETADEKLDLVEQLCTTAEAIDN
jgi:hypothetical protein